jgi:catechol 2,3-dioxygenase-like lactoylglutathione lyase family enzyme
VVQLQASYPVLVTDRLLECRDFYVRWFGFEVGFEASWFVWLTTGGESSVNIAFIHPDHPSAPPSPATYRGDGMFLTLQVVDARAEHDRLVQEGLVLDLPLKDEPWGQRRFGVIDPAGMWIDVVEQIEPQEGWWDPYLSDPST